MTHRNTKCPLCGYNIKRPDGYLTQWQGRSAHVGCAEQATRARKKTEELLKKLYK